MTDTERPDLDLAYGRVLVVDDDAATRRLFEALLAPEGYELAFAATGAQALKILHEQGADVALIDVRMPGMDGFELCRCIRREPRLSRLPIIFVTALDDKASRVKGREAGCDDFVGKPFEETELLARVRNLSTVKLYREQEEAYRTYLQRQIDARTSELEQAVTRLEAAQLELTATREDAIHRICRAAEFRDDESPQHIERMTRYCALLAARMGMRPERIELIRLAAAMHDVGKIGVPDTILFKPGKLTADEIKVMKRHATIGHRILCGAPSELLEVAAEIAYTHHEKWNGEGYPRGLVGPAIPLVGRIAAIADVFDALTSTRPFRPEPFTFDEAFAILRDQRDKHFDPELVDVFLKLRPACEKIHQAYPDHPIQHQPGGNGRN